MQRTFLAICVLAMAGCQPSPPPLVIGHVAPFTGADKAAADQATNGIQLALDDYAAADKSARAFAVRHADDRGDLEATQGQAVRLVKLNHAVALLGGLDPAAAARMDHTEAWLITPIGYRDKTFSELVVSTGLSPARRAAAVGKLLHEVVKPKALVLLVEPGDEWSATESEFAGKWKELKAPAASRIELADPASDAMKAEIEKIGKDVLPVVIASPAVARTLLLETALKDRPVAYAGPELARQPLKGRTPPVYLATAFAGPKADEFAKKYQDKFSAPAEPQAAAAYDDAMLAFELNKRGPLMVARPREELKALKEIPGVGGAAKVADGGVIERPLYVGRVEQGVFHDAGK